jgi:hypothetical protein
MMRVRDTPSAVRDDRSYVPLGVLVGAAPLWLAAHRTWDADRTPARGAAAQMWRSSASVLSR